MLIDAGLPRPGSAFDVKGAGDYVTTYDRRSEAAILEMLARESPGVVTVLANIAMFAGIVQGVVVQTSSAARS